MKLSITEHEANIIEQALEKNIMAKGILKKIFYARLVSQEIKYCDHDYRHYEGKRECCVKCGALGVGMGEEWKLKEEK